MTTKHIEACRDAVTMLRDRCIEARRDEDKRADAKWGLSRLLESEVTAALSPGKLGQLEHLKKLLDVAEGEQSPETISALQQALDAFLDAELGKFGERKGNSMSDENESMRCEACGHAQGEMGETDRQPETEYVRADEFTMAEEALGDHGEQDELEARRSVSEGDKHQKYDNDEARRLAQAQGISAYAARGEVAKRDGYKRYAKEGERLNRATESLRESLRAARSERSVVLPRNHTHADAVVASLQW